MVLVYRPTIVPKPCRIPTLLFLLSIAVMARGAQTFSSPVEEKILIAFVCLHVMHDLGPDELASRLVTFAQGLSSQLGFPDL